MKKQHTILCIFLLFLLLILPSVLSATTKYKVDIEKVIDVNEIYGLEEEVEVTVALQSEINADAIISSEVFCMEYDTKYFMKPITLKKDETTVVKIPGFLTFEEMIGGCVIDVYVHSLFGSEIGKVWTEEFEVIDEIRVIEEPEEEIVEEEPEEEIIEEETIPENTIEFKIEEEPKGKSWLYTTLIVIIIVILAYLFIKFKPKIKLPNFSRKHHFDNNWKF
jgi:hypothetical protein